MNVQKGAVALLVAIFSVVGVASATASAAPMPMDMTVSSAAMAVDAVDDAVKVNQESTVNVNVLGNDKGNNLKVDGFSQPGNGEVKVSPEGGLRYTPNSGYSGLDTFSYAISDGMVSDTAVVTVTVDPVQNPCQSNLNGLTGSVSFDKVHRTVTYKVVLPHPTCSAATLSGDTYVLARGYDRSGEFNESATPGRYSESARSDVTIPRGYRVALTTRSIDVPFKKHTWVMGAIYGGEHQDVLTMPGLPETVATDITSLPRVHLRHNR